MKWACYRVFFLSILTVRYNNFIGANIFVSSDGYIKLGDFGSSIKLKNPFQTNYGEISNMRGTVGKGPEDVNFTIIYYLQLNFCPGCHKKQLVI